MDLGTVHAPRTANLPFEKPLQVAMQQPAMAPFTGQNQPGISSPQPEFSFLNAAGHFLKGIVNPVINAVQNPLTTLAVVGITAGALFLCPPLMPVALAAGIAIGGGQLAYGGYKFATNYAQGNTQGMEESFELFGEGLTALGLSAWGIKQHYQSMGLKEGVVQSLKDSYNVLREIVTKGALPQENTVVLMTTTNKQKIADLSSYLEKNGGGKVQVVSVTDDAAKSQLQLSRGLAADESAYGSTYDAIARGKAAEYTPQELLNAPLQHMKDASLNGKTLAEAFPGRRYVVVADDSGMEMSIAQDKLGLFSAKLKEKGMSEPDIDFFINTNNEQGITGLQRLDGRVEILGVKTHPNLDIIAKRMNFYTPNGKPDTMRAEAMLAEIMKEINLGGEFSFNSAVAARDVLSRETPATHLFSTKGVITDTPSIPGAPVTDPFPLPDIVQVVDETLKINGVAPKLSQAPRDLLSRSQAAKASIQEVYAHATREHAIQTTRGGLILEHLVQD